MSKIFEPPSDKDHAERLEKAAEALREVAEQVNQTLTALRARGRLSRQAERALGEGVEGQALLWEYRSRLLTAADALRRADEDTKQAPSQGASTR
jgi:hypothetical protein